MAVSQRVCPKCGYEAGSRITCPRCGGTIVDRSSLTPAIEAPPASEGMKRCLFCAEEIQAAAIVCRFCGRDVAPAPSNTDVPGIREGVKPAPRRSRAALITFIVLVVGVPSCGLYIWSTSAYSVNEAAAQKVIDGLTSDGLLISHECNPNRAVLKKGTWRAMPNNATREHLMKALARVCIREGAGPRMTVEEDGGVIAQFDGWSVVR